MKITLSHRRQPSLHVEVHTEIEARCAAYAADQHYTQCRKYTGEPYVQHCANVVAILKQYGGTLNQVCAAWLHDTLEDTDAEYEDLMHRFGRAVADMVLDLTDVYVHADQGNRETRKRMERQRLAQIPDASQTVKLADLLDNTSSIVRHDPGFAGVYILEKRALLSAMRGGNQELRWACIKTVNGLHPTNPMYI